MHSGNEAIADANDQRPTSKDQRSDLLVAPLAQLKDDVAAGDDDRVEQRADREEEVHA